MGEPVVVAGGLFCMVTTLLVAAVALAQRRHERREYQRWQQWADHHQWVLAVQPAVPWSRQVPGEVRFAVSGMVRARRVTLAECAVTDADTNTTFFVAAVVALRHRRPDTRVEPRGTMSRLLGTTAKTGRADFDRTFRVRTAEPGWLSTELIEAHLAGAVPSSWSVHGTDLITVRRGHLTTDQVARTTGEALPLAELLDRAGRLPPRSSG